MAVAFAHRRRALRWGALASVALLLLAGLAAAGLSFAAADRLVHPPREASGATPGKRGIPYEPMSLATEDGLALAGWWMPARGAAEGTVVFLHGYGASKAQSLSVASFLHRAGWNVLAFDFRAHGASEGERVTFGIEETRDVRAAWAWLEARPGVDLERVVLFGWSMGGATALLAAPELPGLRAVVVDSAFARLDNVVGNSLASLTGLPAFPFVPLTVGFAGLMTRHRVSDADPADAASRLAQPVLIIHGLSDALVRPDVDALELQAATGARGELWLVPDADHVNARRAHPHEYEQRVLSFLAGHLPPPPDASPARRVLAMAG